jgi:hypothetical protein
MLQQSDGEIPCSPTEGEAFIQQCCRIATIPGPEKPMQTPLDDFFHGKAAPLGYAAAKLQLERLRSDLLVTRSSGRPGYPNP